VTSRERVAALLRRELPDRMGIYEHFWGETIRDYWSGQGYPEGASPEDLFDYDLRGAGGWLDTTPFPGFSELLEETDEWQVTRNGYGASLKYWKRKSGTPEHIGFLVNSPQAWAKYREPLFSFDPSRFDVDAYKRGIAAAHEAGKFAFIGSTFVFELLRGTLGDVMFLESMLADPNWILDFCQVYLDFYQCHYTAIFDAGVRPDAMFIYEDLGFSNGLFCSPGCLRDLIMPFYKELVGFFGSYGLPVILHSCGDVRQAVRLIAEAGFACLQPMEAKAGCNVIELAEEFGDRLAFMGNIDVTVLNTNDRDKVREEVAGKVEALKRLGAAYIFHSDHSIPPDICYDTYRYAVDLFRRHGSYR
jgi:uroporphyrinogen decarboxylase